MSKKRKTIKKIDLHGLRHHMVRNILIGELENLWNSDLEVEIITGHSDSMKAIVREVLDEYKLDYQEGDLINPGYIKTRME